MNRNGYLLTLFAVALFAGVLHLAAQAPAIERCPAVLAVDVGPDQEGFIAAFNDPTFNQQKSVAGLNGATVDGQPCAFTEAPAPPLDSTLSGW
jgi:hypothetical protein